MDMVGTCRQLLSGSHDNCLQVFKRKVPGKGLGCSAESGKKKKEKNKQTKNFSWQVELTEKQLIFVVFQHKERLTDLSLS